MQIVTLKKNTLIRHFIFLLILAIGFGTVVISQNTHTETAEVKLYYVDAQMLRLIPVKTQIPQMSTQKMAQRVADELVEGYDDNPKIRRIIPNVKHGIKVKVLLWLSDLVTADILLTIRLHSHQFQSSLYH